MADTAFFPRILHIVAGAARGGAETFCQDTVLGLYERGVPQHVICRPHAGFVAPLRERGIPFTPLSFGVLDRLGHGSRVIRRTTAAFRPDLVHAWMGRAASFVPRLPIPVLGWFGGYYDLKRYRTSDFYMGVTGDIVAHIVRATGTPERAFVGHTFGTLAPAPPVARATLATPETAPVVLLLARMHPKKGVDTLLRAAAGLPGVYFWLAGEGPNMAEYQALARELDLKKRVRFLGWRTDRAALLGAADVLVTPSRYEPFGTIIVEAWAMDVPLVASRAAGARQYVTDETDGLLCDIDDVEGLAAQLKRAIEDEALRARLIEGGRQAYAANFTKDVVLDRLLENYRAMIKQGKKPA